MKMDAGFLQSMFQVFITLSLTICPGHLMKILSGNSLHFCFKVYCRDFSLLQTDLFVSCLNKEL